MTGGPGWSVGGSAFAGRARALGLSGAVWAGVGKRERESRPGWAACWGGKEEVGPRCLGRCRVGLLAPGVGWGAADLGLGWVFSFLYFYFFSLFLFQTTPKLI